MISTLIFVYDIGNFYKICSDFELKRTKISGVVHPAISTLIFDYDFANFDKICSEFGRAKT